MPRGIYERKPFMKNINPEQDERVYFFLDKGLTCVQTARALGMTRENVQRIRRKWVLLRKSQEESN